MSTLKANNPMEMNNETPIAPEFEDVHRISILTQLQDILHRPQLTPVAWLCLWFADLDSLQAMYTMAKLPGGQAAVLLALQSVDEKFLQTWIDQVVPACRSDSVVFQRQPSYVPVIEGPKESWAMDEQWKYYRPESQDEKQACLTRDIHSCILTRATDGLKTAPIIPNRTFPNNTTNTDNNTTDKSADTFWETLSLFWGKRTVAAWARELNAQNNGTNMLTMAPQVHAAWEKARFALQPHSHSPAERLSVKFVWLKFRKAHLPKRGERVEIMYRPLGAFGVDDGKGRDVGPRGLKFWDNVLEQKVSSGKVVTFSADKGWGENWEGIPLPSWELLRMQWVLKRIVAFSRLVDVDDAGERENWWDDEQWMEFGIGKGEDPTWRDPWGDSYWGNAEGGWPEKKRKEVAALLHMRYGGWKADAYKHERNGGYYGETDYSQGDSNEFGYPWIPRTPEMESEPVEERCKTVSSTYDWW